MANELQIKITTKYDPKGETKFKKALGSLRSGAVAGAKAGIAGFGTAAAGAFGLAAKEALDFGNETNAAMSEMQAKTGATAQQMGQFKQLALGTFGKGLGADIGDVANVMADIGNNTGASGQELQKLTEQALVLRDRFDIDVGESVDGAKVLMDEFGISSTQAFDFMASGVQKGLNRSGDLVDTIREYGNLFGDAGFNAGEFFSLLDTGSEGGVLGTDKVADAFKEFQIRFLEGSDKMNDAILELTEGDGWGMFVQEIEGGDSTIKDVFGTFTRLLGEMEDPIARNRIQAELFGTAAEDLGVSFTEGLSTGTTKLEDLAGATADASKKSTDLGTDWENAMRQFQVATEPAAQEVLPMLSEGIQSVGEFFMAAQPAFTEFAGNLKETVGPAMDLIGDAVERIGAAFGIAEEGASGLDVAVSILSKALGIVVTGIQGAAIAAQGLAWVAEQIGNATRAIKQFIEATRSASRRRGGSGGFVRGMLGFQHGGSFVVGGQGGPDSQMVAFRASPGERVSVTPPGQTAAGGGGGGPTINVLQGAQFGSNLSVADLQEFGNQIAQAVIDSALIPALE